MAVHEDFLQFIVEQVQGAGEIRFKRMFGDAALYCNGKVVALICDDQFFIKPTEAGKMYIKNIVESPPYPGAKMYFLIEDKLEDSEWLTELVRLTASELEKNKK